MTKVTQGIAFNPETRAEMIEMAKGEQRSLSFFLTEIVWPEWKAFRAAAEVNRKVNANFARAIEYKR